MVLIFHVGLSVSESFHSFIGSWGAYAPKNEDDPKKEDDLENEQGGDGLSIPALFPVTSTYKTCKLEPAIVSGNYSGLGQVG